MKKYSIKIVQTTQNNV